MRGKLLLISLLLIFGTLVVFWQVRTFDFVYFDDDLYITDNPHLQDGFNQENVIWAFTNNHVGLWLPLTWLSFMLDYELYGLNPGGYHFTNVLFHLLNTLLLFFILRRITGSLYRSALVAALFALHPLHVESVAWVTERKDVLSTLFWMLTLWFYVQYAAQPRLYHYLLALFTFALGLMAKPMLVTLPFVLLLMDYWPLGRFQSGQCENHINSEIHESTHSNKLPPGAFRLLLEKLPFLVLAAAASWITFLAQQSWGAAASVEVLPARMRVANAMVAYIRYMGKMIWPQKLAVFYPHPGNTLPIWQVVGAGFLLSLMSLLAFRARHRYPYLLVGWLWYLGTLVPVIGLVQVGKQSMADRFTYIPLIGLFIIIAWTVPCLLAKWRYQKIALFTSATLVLVALMIVTRFQVGHWRNSITLFEHTLAVTTDNPVIHNNLGKALIRRGEIDKARFHYAKALQLQPNSAKAHTNLGNILEQQGKLEEAMHHYYSAVRLDPKLAEAHFNLGNALIRQGKNQEAASHFAMAVQLNGHFAEAHNSLGVSLARQGRFDEAIAHFSKALQIKPDYPQAQRNLGLALQQADRENTIRTK
jgi:Flp pilus assembly protein TadD